MSRRFGVLGVIVLMVGGVAVQALPPMREAFATIDCTIFESKADAQAVLDTGPLDPASLDPDGNGVACDGLIENEATSSEGDGGTPVDGASPVSTPVVSLPTLLPSVEESPIGILVERDEERSVEDVAYQLSGQSLDAAEQMAASDRLAKWGFQQAVVRYYQPDLTPPDEAPDDPAPPPPSGIQWLWVSAYRFVDPSQAAEAFDGLSSAALVADSRLRAVEFGDFGDRSEAYTSGDADGLFHLWILTGFDVVWIAGTATGEMPAADVEALGRVVVLRSQGEGPGTGLRIGGLVAPVTGANLRADASTSAAVVTILPSGVPLVITGEAVANEGRDWWPVEVIASGETGWVAAELLAAI